MRRRGLTTATVFLSLTVAAAALTGCGALDKAFDCVRTADAIATSVDQLSRAVADGSDPTQLAESLDTIDEEIGNLKNTTGDADLSKAVDDLSTAVESVRTAVENGDATPDLSGVTGAATEVGRICTP
ncbi:hypothetical protein I3F58_13070 [Streptomyces sp. MUM 203J]|uniref:hypothetical protein n=1 Tax=Streptomyces sp. MUM 203J TaxID=2791990 RepID=UPI001F044D1A|nr:hypothetical protein [Streptomyces sp. MUM 203J]MCH0540486.1 hypothetical protein [Streptomyces sp. MUM 203J]